MENKIEVGSYVLMKSLIEPKIGIVEEILDELVGVKFGENGIIYCFKENLVLV